MNDNQFMHIRMDFDDAMSLKREILYSEVHFIKLFQRLQRFSALRTEESLLREVLSRLLHEMRSDVNFFEKRLPKFGEKFSSKKKSAQQKEQKKPKKKTDSVLEVQLEEIKQKLNSLNF